MIFRTLTAVAGHIDLSVFRRPGWDTVLAVPHGAVFSRP
jgi:hypothetical protein